MGRYDGSLQMFVQEGRYPDQSRLEEVRWRVENGRLGNRSMLGRPTGEFAKAFGYEGMDGQALKDKVSSNPAPEGLLTKVRLEGLRGRERE